MTTKGTDVVRDQTRLRESNPVAPDLQLPVQRRVSPVVAGPLPPVDAELGAAAARQAPHREAVAGLDALSDLTIGDTVQRSAEEAPAAAPAVREHGGDDDASGSPGGDAGGGAADAEASGTGGDTGGDADAGADAGDATDAGGADGAADAGAAPGKAAQAASAPAAAADKAASTRNRELGAPHGGFHPGVREGMVASGVPGDVVQMKADGASGAVGAGAEVNQYGAKLSVSAEFSSPPIFKKRAFTAKVLGGISAAGEVKWSSGSGPAAEDKSTTGGASQGIKIPVKIYEAAKKDIKTETKSWFERLEPEEVEVEFAAGRGKGDNESSVGIGVAFKSKWGPFSITGGADVIRLKSEDGNPFQLEALVLKAEGEGAFPLNNRTLPSGATYSAVSTLKGGVEIEPNRAVIARKVFTKLGPAIARRFGVSMSRVLANMANPGVMASAFMFGGYLTLAGLYDSIQHQGAIKDCVKNANDAILSYQNGWMTGLGIEGYTGGGNDAFWDKGRVGGRNAIDSSSQNVAEMDQFAMWGFTAREIRAEMRRHLRANPDTYYRQVYPTVQARIKREYFLKWYHSSKAAESILTYGATDRDAKYLKQMLGLDDPTLPGSSF